MHQCRLPAVKVPLQQLQRPGQELSTSPEMRELEIAKSLMFIYYHHIVDYDEQMTEANKKDFVDRNAFPGYTINESQMKYIITNVKKSTKHIQRAKYYKSLFLKIILSLPEMSRNIIYGFQGVWQIY